MINNFALQGRLTRDPELRTTASGVEVCSFTVAWSEKYKEIETQLFMDCTAWRGTGDFVNKYWSKGQEIVVEGKLHTEKWEDKNGNNRSSIRMTVDKAHFCGPKQDGSTQRASDNAAAIIAAVGGPDVFAEVEDDGDLPF